MSLKFLSPMTLSLNLGSMFQLYVGTASSMLILSLIFQKVLLHGFGREVWKFYVNSYRRVFARL